MNENSEETSLDELFLKRELLKKDLSGISTEIQLRCRRLILDIFAVEQKNLSGDFILRRVRLSDSRFEEFEDVHEALLSLIKDRILTGRCYSSKSDGIFDTSYAIKH